MPRRPGDHPVVTEDDAIIVIPLYAPRTKPTPIPTASIFDEPKLCIEINVEWVGHLVGVIAALDQKDTWTADGTHDVEWARREVVEWMAKLLLGDGCDMSCCEDQVALLTTMVENLTTIVANLTTVINQGDTTIDQDETIIYNQYVDQFNNYSYNNSVQQTINSQLYDGDAHSIAPSIGSDFSDGTSNSEARLCSAIQAFISNQLYTYGTQAALIAGAAGITSAVFLGLGTALAVFTGGLSAIVGAAISATILGGLTLWNAILNDPDAQRKVKCCMFDALKDQVVTESIFQHCFDDYCGFDPSSNEGHLAQQLSNSVMYYPADYLAFLRFYEAASGVSGSAEACSCGCDSDIELEDFAGTGCVITYIGNCIYRMTQTTPTVIGSATVYYYSFRDIMSQCLLVENSPDPLTPTQGVGLDTTTVDCAGVETAHYVGGFSGSDSNLRSAHWSQADTVTYYKITLVV